MMVAAVTTSSCGNTGSFPKSRSSIYLLEQDKTSITEAASGVRRSRSKETAPSNLASSILSSSKSNSSCIPAICSSSSSSSSSISFATPPQCEPTDFCSNAAARTVSRLTTRSLSVSFQDKLFFFQTTKAKPTVECREANAVGIENNQSDQWQNSRSGEWNSTTGGWDFSANMEHSLLETVQLLHHSGVLDEVVNFNIGVGTESLDSESILSVIKSSSPESGFQVNVQAKPLGICVPARFRQVDGYPQPHAQSPAKIVTGKRQISSSTQLASTRGAPSPPCGLANSSSPSEFGFSRFGKKIMERYSIGTAVNAPSILSFAYEVRRRKKGESLIEDAHFLRLLHNRYLQWRYINACAEHTISTQMLNVKNKLYHTWMTISELRNSAMNKRVNLQVLMQNLKLASILKGQIVYLEESSNYNKNHEISFKGCMEALKASTLSLSVTGGTKVNIKEVKEAVNSAIGVVQSMMASICSFLSQVERISSLVVELGKLAAHEQAILNQTKYLLSIIATLHVKQTSLQSYMLQLQRNKK